ncbi:MAG: malonyl-CoA synthase [Syntrophobacteraceae bacterium]|nr:malonyl-CoA synthase [Syntrophobacteraceae bacterium]
MGNFTDQNLYDFLKAGFPAAPRTPCMLLPDGSVITYGMIDEQSARFANLLVALGVRPGDRVAVQVKKSPRALCLYLGSLRAGAVYLPINDAYLANEVEYFLADAEPRVFVCAPQACAMAEKAASKAGVSHVVELDGDGEGSLARKADTQPGNFSKSLSGGDDLGAILYTSGTTGRSKGAMLSHRNLAVNGEALKNHWGFGPGDVLLHMLPIFHVHGLFVATHCVLLSGGRMFFEPRFDTARALRLLPRSTVFMGVPTYYARLLAAPELTPELCSNMRLFVSGSAPLSIETFEKFTTVTGHTVLERYGMTEGGMFCSNPLVGKRRGGTVGFPLEGVSVRVAGDNNQPAGTGQIGEVQVKGDNIFRGYWRLPDKTKEEFTPDGFFKTGDMGKWDADGHLAIVGRSKDIVITGGLNVYPKEVEEAIDKMSGVAESAVIGTPHPDFGEAVTAVIVKTKDELGAALTEGAVIGFIKGNLANFKVPKKVHFATELPRNTMGKVQKNILRQMFE